MTTKKATTSTSGAYMSQYNKEVEDRLKALEEAVAELKANDKAQQEVDVRFAELENKIQKLWN
jgi:hypothetical protein